MQGFLHTKRDAGKDGNREGRGEVKQMYYSIKSGGWQRIAEPTGQEEGLLGIFPYEKMLACGKKWGISAEILEEARRFSYARYDSFENFDCVSLEMLDFENILLSIGSVILYLEKGKAFFFTSKIDIVTALLEECLEGLGERVTLNRVIYSFFELQTKKDDIIFDSIEKEIMDLEQALIATGKRVLNVLDILVENENGIFDGKTLRSFKMLYRRTERRFQNVLNLREYVTQVRESYEAEVDISLNTTMKIFTVVTTIFLPLTLIVGWYGMNLKMPEYGWKYGYLFVGLLSLTCIAGIIIFFKRKKWF